MPAYERTGVGMVPDARSCYWVFRVRWWDFNELPQALTRQLPHGGSL